MAEGANNSSGSNGKKGGKPASTDETEKEEVRYSVDELVERSRDLLGEGKIATSGALAGESRQTLTIEQAKDAIRKFLRSEV